MFELGKSQPCSRRDSEDAGPEEGAKQAAAQTPASQGAAQSLAPGVPASPLSPRDQCHAPVLANYTWEDLWAPGRPLQCCFWAVGPPTPGALPLPHHLLTICLRKILFPSAAARASDRAHWASWWGCRCQLGSGLCCGLPASYCLSSPVLSAPAPHPPPCPVAFKGPVRGFWEGWGLEVGWGTWVYPKPDNTGTLLGSASGVETTVLILTQVY